MGDFVLCIARALFFFCLEKYDTEYNQCWGSWGLSGKFYWGIALQKDYYTSCGFAWAVDSPRPRFWEKVEWSAIGL